MPELTIGLLVCDIVIMLFVGIRLSIYTFSLQDRIREDPRYEKDREWSSRASWAIGFHTVDKFALREGLIESVPRWVPVYKKVYIVGATIAMFLFVRVMHGE